MNEHSFIRKIHGQLPTGIEAWKINDTNKIGVADCYYDGPVGGPLFIEYKWKALPVRDATLVRSIGVSPMQRHWLYERHARGVRVGVIMGTPVGAVILPGLLWDAAFTAGDLRNMMVPHKEVVTWLTAQCTGAISGNIGDT